MYSFVQIQGKDVDIDYTVIDELDSYKMFKLVDLYLDPFFLAIL